MHDDLVVAAPVAHLTVGRHGENLRAGDDLGTVRGGRLRQR